MSRTKVSDILQPLCCSGEQVYYGRGLHTLGLIRWILQQIGPSEIVITTFSTSDQFLRGFLLLRDEQLVTRATLLLDLKATKKTAQLKPLMASAFEDVYLGENHAKVIIFRNKEHFVLVNSSLNQTYGGRNECTTITCNKQMAISAMNEIVAYCAQCLHYDIHSRTN